MSKKFEKFKKGEELEKFIEGINRLEKKPSPEEIGEVKLVIRKGKFLKPTEKIKVKINNQEKEGEIIEEEGIRYLKSEDEIFVFLLPEKDMYNLSISSQIEEVYQVKRENWIVLDIRHKSEEILIFFIDEKEKKVYNKGQLINPDKFPQNKFEGFEVKKLKEGRYRLSFYIESKGMFKGQEYHYRIGYDNFNPKEEGKRIYENIAGI